MRKLLMRLLRHLAVRVLARERPTVVAVAGSVGKTSTRSAVAAALGKSFRVGKIAKNFNNEIGMPLAILGEAKSGGADPFSWLGIMARGFWRAYGPAPAAAPNALVLEMATDAPGDLAYLTGIARPDAAVVTAVAEEHTEFLGDLDGVAKEEGTVVEALSQEGTAILNADDARVLAMRARTAAKVLTYGLAPGADVRAEHVETETAMDTLFTRFDLVAGGKRVPVTLSGCIGEGNVYAALAGAAAALALGVALEHVPYGLAGYQPPPGRMRPIPGKNGTLLIDDTYNSSPRAAELALRTLMTLPSPGGRRIAVLADMLELGALSEASHRRIGALAAELKVSLLVGVGPLSLQLCDEARAKGLPEAQIRHFPDNLSAAQFLEDSLEQGDIALIKGSQGLRMEKAVKALMAQPEQAYDLLPRQDWRR